MLPPPAAPRHPSARDPFQPPLWDDDHPEFRRIDALLPADHHARWLAAVVARLDLAPVRASYANRGSPAYPPELLLPFVLLMFSQAELSPAEWARQATYDDQAKWLLRGLRPSRSQLYAFRDRLRPFLDGWHAQVVAWAKAEGLTTAQRVSLDGTFVAALASRHRLLRPRRLDERLVLLRLLAWADAHQPGGDLGSVLTALPGWARRTADGQPLPLGDEVAQALRPLLAPVAAKEVTLPQAVPAWVPPTVAGRRRVLRRYEAARERLDQRLEPYRDKKLTKKEQEVVDKVRVSPTDPEAALGVDKVGTYRPLYDFLLVQATDAPLTLAWDLLSRCTDHGLIPPMMDRARQQVGHYPEELLVDDGFVSITDVTWCKGAGIKVYAPPTKPAGAEGGAGPRKAGKGKSKGKKKLAKRAFRYDPLEDVYHCPQGKRLRPAARTTERLRTGVVLPMVRYRASGQDCQACPLQPGCTSNPERGRLVNRYQGEEVLEQLQQRMQDPEAQRVYRLRCQSVELGHADLKEHRGLRVFRCFGHKRAWTQAGLVVLASNGLKVMQALRRRAAQLPPAPEEKCPA
jgi:transposase